MSLISGLGRIYFRLIPSSGAVGEISDVTGCQQRALTAGMRRRGEEEGVGRRGSDWNMEVRGEKPSISEGGNLHIGLC